MGGLDLVGWPADRTLVISGAPDALRIPLLVRNTSGEPAGQVEASFSQVRPAGGGEPLESAPAPVQLSVPANGVARAHMRLRLDPSTPPGAYEGTVQVGGISRGVVFTVLPEAKLQIRPDIVVVDASGGPEQQVTASFDNQGNVPLTIDLEGAYPLAQEVPTGPDELEEAGNKLADVLDRLAARPRALRLKPFGEVRLAMPEGPRALDPGTACTAQVSVRLPEELSPTARYHVFAPLYASDLHLVIVTAAKPRQAAPPAGRTKGAAA